MEKPRPIHQRPRPRTLPLLDALESRILLSSVFMPFMDMPPSGLSAARSSELLSYNLLASISTIRPASVPHSWGSGVSVDQVPGGLMADQPVTLTAHVVSTTPDSGSVLPTGTVDFFEGQTEIGSVSLSNGSATLNHPFSSGDHSITATYDGDANFLNASTGTPMSFTLATAPTVVTNSSSSFLLAYAASTPLIVTVTDTSGHAVTAGQVALQVVGTGAILNTKALDSSGQAHFSIIGLVPGDLQIVSEYLSQDPYANSSSDPISVSVTKALPSVDATLSSYQLVTTIDLPGGTAGFTAAATGTVTLLDNGSASSTLTLTSAGATFDLSGLSVGRHTLTISYSGDADYQSATSRAIQKTIPAPVATTTTLTASSQTTSPGVAITLSATVKAPGGGDTLAGTVVFYGNSAVLGSAPLSGGSASLQVSFSQAGAQDIYAEFQPTSHHVLSDSAHLSVSVNAPPVIDLLVLYTPQELAAAGSRDNVLAGLQQDIDQANQAYINSQIPLELHLTALVATAYNESGSLATDLNHLSRPHDHVMDDVPGLRDALAADLVILLDSNGTNHAGGGITLGISTGLLDPNAAQRDQAAFVVVDEAYALQYYVLAHEIGHTLGAAHAINDPSPQGAAPYAHGYRFTGDDGVVYHDIMAYPPGTIIPYFSNPNITYAGVPIGKAGVADASRIIREQAPFVAAYRTPQPTGAIETTSLSQITGYAFDPDTTDPIDVRIDIDNQTRATISANIERDDLTPKFGITVQGFSYALPRLSQGKHTISIYGIDPDSGAAVLIGTTKLTAPTPLFDEAYYLANNPDVVTLIAQHKFASAWDQFNRVGQFQGKDPSAYFDTQYFLAQNPTVAAMVQKHQIKSAFAYFLSTGQKKGLVASTLFDEAYYLSANPAAAAAVAKGKFHSGLEQYLLVGQYEDLSPLPATI